MMLHILFPKRSWLIEFATSAYKGLCRTVSIQIKGKKFPLTVLASASSPTDIKSTSVFSLLWRTWSTVQILCSFCSSLECHSTNPKIGDCSLTAASDHWNVFCYTTATGLPLYPLLTRLHWRRSMKRRSMKYVLEKICYDQHKWFICVDLKMVNFLLGQQSGFTKYPCFLYMRDSRDRAQHYTKNDWLLRE